MGFALVPVAMSIPLQLTWPWSEYCLSISKPNPLLCSKLPRLVKVSTEMIFQFLLLKIIEIPILSSIHRFVLHENATIGG